MKHRIIALCITLAMLLSFASSMATVGTAASIRGKRLTGMKVYDAENNLTRESEYQYEGGFLTGILVRRSYEEDTYEHSTTLTYDAAGRLASRISGDPDTPGMNAGTEYTYNSAGQMVSCRSWEGGSVTETYEYDAEGKRIRAVQSSDPGEAITEYSYNEKGLLIGATETWTNEWDGEVITSTTAYSYDSQNRLIRESYSGRYGDAETTYSYQYQPFVLRESSRDYSSTELLLLDNSGLNLESFYLDEPEFFMDSEGYLAKVVDTDSYSGEVETYEFYYDGVAAETDSENPALFEGNLNEFMKQEAYQAYWASTVSDYRVPTQYAFIDINKDGNQELIICSDNEMGFYSFALFEYHKDTNQVTSLPIPAPGYEIHSCYGGLEYSDMYSAIVFTETNNGAAFGGLAYYSMNGGILDRCFSIGFENYDGSGRKYHTSEKDDISEEKYYEYISESVVIEFLPIADFVPAESSTSAYEDYARSEWIEQHIEYAASDEYQKEIVRGFTGSLNDLFADIKNDDVISSYSTLDSINQILSFDLDLSETQEYELLLGQIFFSYVGEDAIEEIYAENMTKAVIMLGEIILMLDDFKQIGDSEQLEGILNALKSSKGVDAMNAACDRFFNFVDGYDNIDIKEHLTGSIKKESFNLAWDVTIDSLDLVTTTLKELTMYIAAGEAYSQTSDAFGEVLLGMRRKINVSSDNPVFEPIATKDLVTNEVIWNLTTPNDSPFPDPLNTPVVLKDLANAIENFYTSIETYKNESSDYIAQKAIEDLKDGAVNDVLINNGENAALSLSSCLPIVREYKIIKDILSTGQSLIDLMTSIDDQEYLGTMFIRLYCISYLHYLAVDNLAGDPQSWESVPWGYNSTPGMILETNENQDLYEYQFERATSFDEAVNVYKSISIVAAEYALKYSNIFLGEALAELNEYDNGGFPEQFLKNRDKLVEAVNDYKNTVVKLESQRTEIQAISCHDSDLQYDSVNDEIIYNFKDSRIYVVACPVDVIVKNESGEQIAYLSGEENEILDGYEFYFRTIKIQDDSGEYIKVAIVPNHYQIEMKGTDNGVMNAFVADFTTGDVGEVETYFNIPVEKDSVGYFEVSAEVTDQSSLVMDQVAYTNMESEADLPTNWGNFNTWIWVAGGAVVFAVILIVIFSIKKKSRK